MAKNQNDQIRVVKALLRDMLTTTAQLHKRVQLAGKAAKGNDSVAMLELIAELPALAKEAAGMSATILEHARNTAE
jgi:hypothetical protein